MTLPECSILFCILFLLKFGNCLELLLRNSIKYLKKLVSLTIENRFQIVFASNVYGKNLKILSSFEKYSVHGDLCARDTISIVQYIA